VKYLTITGLMKAQPGINFFGKSERVTTKINESLHNVVEIVSRREYKTEAPPHDKFRGR
jgi:hypothetical protein